MHRGAQSYAETAQRTAGPRELEAQLLLRAAAKLQAAGPDDPASIRGAVIFNRRLWKLLVTAVPNPEHPLPTLIRDNVANLGIFVLGRSIEIEAVPDAGRIGVLVNITRQLAAGLSGH